MFKEKDIPIQKIKGELLTRKNIQMDMKRLDLLHPVISGNKWYKLKYNLERAVDEGYETAISFGGAYSNHIHALAGAANELGLKSIGIIRGEETLPLNPTLRFAIDNGMQIEYLNRAEYRRKNKPEFLSDIRKKHGKVFIIPEGGSNSLAVQGCMEILDGLEKPYDYVILPVGTGGTIAGIIAANNSAKIIGIPVLKGEFLKNEIEGLLSESRIEKKSDYELISDYHFGGYAKFNQELIDFINNFKSTYGIPLDPIYSGKMVYGSVDLIKNGSIENGSAVLMIHTGGIQGIEGFNIRFGNLIE